MSESLAKGWGGALPSHLTQAQVARVLGLSHQAVSQRIKKGLPVFLIAGSNMIPTAAVLESYAENFPAYFAFTPEAILALASEAVTALQESDPDRPIFSARQLLGCYLGLSRQPWPPALS